MAKLDLGHLLIVGGFSLAFYGLVAFCPIYCGWRVLDRRDSKPPFATIACDWLFGAITMLLGLLYFVLFAINEGMELRTMWFDSTYGQFNWDALPSFGLLILMVTAFFVLPLFALFGGVFLCGAVVGVPQKWRRALFSFPPRRWQKMIGASALLIGLLGSIWAMIEVVVLFANEP